jgi:hypothetical protein
MPDIPIRDLKPATRDLDPAARASDVDAARRLADRITAYLSGREHPDSAGLVREVRDR